MISLILYGRNDSYGYNLHKRAAISLNCMAEMLTAPDDEIIFVDYNTPDDFPTFPEAIQDTLTERAKKLLRILRVRPSQHAPFRHLTSLVALEPIARNVAVRRSNPANRWVLSTNTDMVFVPQRGTGLSDVVAALPDAYYPLPRFEVPETLWESADRLDPKGTIEAFRAWGRTFHLNEIVLGADPIVKYDAPGDFQLALRSDLWEMHGFHEAMLLGWHVDSNLAKRLSLLPREAGEILDDVFGYHCDHTRQVTPAHRPRAAENDLEVFFGEVTSAQIPEQAETWGLAGETIEEINVNATSRLYLEALRSVTPTPLSGLVPRIQYSYEQHNRIDYAVEHVLPFVADAVASYPRNTSIGWFGCKRMLLDRFAQAWKAMGFSRDILVPDGAHWLGPNLPAGCVWGSARTLIESADLFVFDWGRRDGVSEESWDFRNDGAAKETLRALRLAVRAERRRLAEGTGQPRRFIGVNAVCNDAEQTFHELVGAARTPIATRLRQGYVSELLPHMNLLPALNAGGAARKVSGVIVARPGVSGCIFYLSHLLLDAGAYQLCLEFDVASEADAVPGYSGVGLSVTTNSCLIGNRPITEGEVGAGSMTLDFVIPEGIGDADDFPETEFQMRTLGRAEITIRSATLAKSADLHVDTSLTDFNFFPLLTVGPGGTYGPAPEPAQQVDHDLGAPAVRSEPGVADFLVYGPHVWLMPGRYEATFEFWVPASERRGIEGRIEIVSAFGAQIHAEQFLDFSEPRATPGETWKRVRCVLGFDIRTVAPPELDGLLEFRVWSEGADFSLAAVDVHRVGDPGPAQPPVERLFGGRLASRYEAVARQVRRAYLDHVEPPDVLWLAQPGHAGRRVPGAIEALTGVIGLVMHGPYVWLLPGHYEVAFDLFGVGAASVTDDIGLEVVSELGNQILAADVVPVGAGSQTCSLFFDITTDAPPVASGLLEFRVWSPGTIAFNVSAVRIREIDLSRANAKDAERSANAPLFGGRLNPILTAVAREVRQAYLEGSQPINVLRRLRVGPVGRKTANSIEAVAGEAGVLAHGPYVWLLPGRYEVAFELVAKRVASGSHVKLEVVTEFGNRVLAERFIEPHWYGRRFERALGRRSGVVRFVLPFEITTDMPAHGGLLEFRVWSPGTIPFKLTAVYVRQVDALYPEAEFTALRSP